MDIYLDTADIAEIEQGVKWGLIDGVTTNPSLLAKTGKSFKEVVPRIVELVDGPISIEVISEKAEGMLIEARAHRAIHKNVVVKIPMTEEGIIATRKCAQENIPVNVTLIFSPTQALLAAKAGASYVSPFIGRLDDISHVGMELVEQVLTIFDNYEFDTRVIVASVRNPIHVLDAALAGADIVTVPFPTLKALFKHPLTDIGVKKFLDDNAKIPKG